MSKTPGNQNAKSSKKYPATPLQTPPQEIWDQFSFAGQFSLLELGETGGRLILKLIKDMKKQITGERGGCILETTDCLLWEEGRSDGYHALPNVSPSPLILHFKHPVLRPKKHILQAEGQDPGDVLQLVLLLLHALRHCPQLAGPYWCTQMIRLML